MEKFYCDKHGDIEMTNERQILAWYKQGCPICLLEQRQKEADYNRYVEESGILN